MGRPHFQSNNESKTRAGVDATQKPRALLFQRATQFLAVSSLSFFFLTWTWPDPSLFTWWLFVQLCPSKEHWRGLVELLRATTTTTCFVNHAALKQPRRAGPPAVSKWSKNTVDDKRNSATAPPEKKKPRKGKENVFLYFFTIIPWSPPLLFY